MVVSPREGLDSKDAPFLPFTRRMVVAGYPFEGVANIRNDMIVYDS